MTDSEPTASRWRTYLHRIGYVTTAIVTAQFLFIAYMVVPEWWEQQRMDAAQRENTRTHVGTLAGHREDSAWERTISLFAELPKSTKTARDSFRIVVAPSLSSHWYALAMAPAGNVKGKIVVDFVTVTDNVCDIRTAATTIHRTFTLPEPDYRAFASWFDATTDGYAGSSVGVLDGTRVTFERRKAGRITSGSGNAPDHYGAIAARLLALLKPHLTGPDIPTRGSWHISASDEDCPS